MVNFHKIWTCPASRCSLDLYATAMNQKHENFPTALEAFFLIVFLLGAEVLLNMLVHDSMFFTGVSMEEVDGVIMVLANAILFTAVLHYKGMSYSELFHSAAAVTPARLCLIMVPVMLLIPGLELSLSFIGGMLEEWQPVPAGQQRIFDEMMSNGVHSIIIACLVAPVLEEMLFRGLVLRSFLQQYSRKLAFLASALLFGMAHMNIYQFLCASLLGLVCAWLYDKTRSLWPGIALHAGSNGVALYAYRWTAARGISGNWHPSTALCITALVSTSIGIYLLRRMLVVKDLG